MNEIYEQLRTRWSAYCRNGDPAPLLELLRQFPELTNRCGHSYPFLHRITSVILEDQAYWLGRCVLCNERLMLVPIDREFFSPDPGVPLELTGEALRQWVEHESRQPAKGPVDWTRYMNQE